MKTNRVPLFLTIEQYLTGNVPKEYEYNQIFLDGLCDVYFFLAENGECLYVGKTVQHPLGRLDNHIYGKWSSFYYKIKAGIPLSRKWLFIVPTKPQAKNMFMNEIRNRLALSESEESRNYYRAEIRNYRKKKSFPSIDYLENCVACYLLPRYGFHSGLWIGRARKLQGTIKKKPSSVKLIDQDNNDALRQFAAALNT